MAYIGQSIKNGTFSVLDTSGNTYNGSNTTFSLGTQVGSAAQLLVSHDGVIQKPGTDFTLASGGTQITFTTAPASGASIFIVEISGAVGGPINSDLNGNELVLDVDGDTSIHADTDDQIDFKTGGTDRVVINSSGNVGIKNTSPSHTLDISDNTTTAKTLRVGQSSGTSNADATMIIGNGGNGDAMLRFDYEGSNTDRARLGVTSSGQILRFYTAGNNERMQINNSGMVMIGDTSGDAIANNGINLTAASQILISRGGGDCGTFNRNTNDGQILNFAQAGSTEGNISVSGSTVSYNGFTGTHWSRLTDNSKPTILKGTILESLDEMCDWYQVQFDITETDDEGKETTRTKKQSYALGDGESVGDVITYTYEGTDYQATIIQEGDVKHTKSKVSDTVDAKNVYGVFVAWDNDDDTVNDMYVAQTGTFVIRIHKDETVSKGDLIQSKGDGTGKVQADDIMRASTVAKVLSTTKIETYSDGSYIVPCSLHC